MNNTDKRKLASCVHVSYDHKDFPINAAKCPVSHVFTFIQNDQFILVYIGIYTRCPVYLCLQLHLHKMSSFFLTAFKFMQDVQFLLVYICIDTNVHFLLIYT